MADVSFTPVSARLSEYTPSDKDDDTASLLKLFLRYLPKDGGQVLMHDILDQNDDDLLRQLRFNLVDSLLKPLKASGGKTALPTPSPVPEVGDDVDELMTKIEPSSQSEQGKLKHSCLQRDSYRCVLSGNLDESKGDDPAYSDVPDINSTDCSHILPFALASFDSDKIAETEIKSRIWTAIYRYFPAVKAILSSETCNDMTNAMTVSSSLHQLFGGFAIALQPLHDTVNTYRILTFSSLVNRRDVRLRGLPTEKIVTLSSSDSSLPLPHPDLLRAHCSIAKILHVSGVGKLVDSSLREMHDNPSALDSNGSTDIASIIQQSLLMKI